MKLIILVSISVLLSKRVQDVSCDKINIIPSPDSAYPTMEAYLTLQQYIANPSLSSDVTLVLYPGIHTLNTQFIVPNNTNFTMVAAKAAPSVVCSQEHSNFNYWFDFKQTQNINISGMIFSNCTMSLSIDLHQKLNVIITKSSFVNTTVTSRNLSGVLTIPQSSSLQISQCTFSNNNNMVTGSGAIYAVSTSVEILNSTFSNNTVRYNSLKGGAVYIVGKTVIANSNFRDNSGRGSGGAVYVISTSTVSITGSNFSKNNAGLDGGGLHAQGLSGGVSITDSNFYDNVASTGGAVSIGSGDVKITGCHFSGNVANHQGGAIGNTQYGSIVATSTTFLSNTARTDSGGAIYCGFGCRISLTNATFKNNTAAYCGAINFNNEDTKYPVKITSSSFSSNRAIGQNPISDSGGAICTSNAKVAIMSSNFSYNSVTTGDGGVMHVDQSTVTVNGSIFTNNTSAGNGGVLSYRYPGSLTVVDSSFISNKADKDGGVVYVGRVGSHVMISESTFAFNQAVDSGGVFAIIASTLSVNSNDVCNKNNAKLGKVIYACNGTVTISGPEISSSPDPDDKFCKLYNC